MGASIALALMAFIGAGLAASARIDGAYREKTMFAFPWIDEGDPVGGVIADAGGALYGVSDGHKGTVYKLTRSGNQYTESILYVFQHRKLGGSRPVGGLAMDASGVLYGVTRKGGHDNHGTVYSVTPGSGGYTHKIIYNFPGRTYGREPQAGLIIDGAGNLFGTTALGGNTACRGGCGTVFEISPSSSGYAEGEIYRFHGPDGQAPRGPLLEDAGGDLFGTTASGGAHGDGTVFELTPHGSGYAQTVLYSFAGGSDGVGPTGALAISDRGHIYGSTQGGGTAFDGTVFVLIPVSSGYAERVIHSFAGPDGKGPVGGVTLQAGIVFGTTQQGGDGDGVAYSLTPHGAAYREKILYLFQGGYDGDFLTSGLLPLGGAFYGTAAGGGTGWGTVFRLTP
jgi:uncharacterized repeat protein (TIGR03803 family)